jgi:6,7-dimethyl-8-ribityllumazine synthase
MAAKKKNLSEYKQPVLKQTGSLQIGILVSEWNEEITHALCDGAVKTLVKHGVKKKNIFIEEVPGSYELPLAAQMMAEYRYVDAILCLGCVIQGETRHFEFISQAVAHGVMNVGLEQKIPVVFGVLTTDNYQQAKERAGGKHGNKGVEAAAAALKMIALHEHFMDTFELPI